MAVIENVRIADFCSTAGKRKSRFIGLCVVNANGNSRDTPLGSPAWSDAAEKLGND